ncbi:hypothetical protein B0H19DRAFT_116573 [Mycena capillaripes]|nr:hypothetical protein B0H19DRAFT_116573 [Mycena capillaripes]
MSKLGTRASDFGARSASVYILAFLILPAIQTLEIRGVDDFSETVLDVFPSLSSPPLRKLLVRSLDLEGGSELKLSSTFKALGLTDLEVCQSSKLFADRFFDYLGGDGLFLPQLRNLPFLGCRNTEATVYDIILKAATPITKRRKTIAGCAQFQSFRVIQEKRRNVYEWTSYKEKVLLPFRQLKASGMDIYIGTEEKSAI